jgi:hypothetical protein
MELSDDKQIELLATSIEESSKHARNLLLTLVVSSLYVLLAAYSTGVHNTLKLPVLDVDVDTSEFYAISPIIILAIFMYMHIYVSDLRSRLAAFDNLNIPCNGLPSPRF